MPDWTYHTVFRPVLFRLGADKGRALALGAMGRLAQAPLGRRVIRLMGHMAPDRRLEVERDGLQLASRVGLGCRLDSQLAATGAFAEFGFGFIEIGPITATGDGASQGRSRLDPESEALVLAGPGASLSVDEANRRLERLGALGTPLFARIEATTAAEAVAILQGLPAAVAAIVVPVARLDGLLDASEPDGSPRPVYAAVQAEEARGHALQDTLRLAISESKVQGVVVAENISAQGGAVELGRRKLAGYLEAVRELRAALGVEPTIVAGAGIHSPADALDCLEAGADLVQIDTGLIFAGPGLPKRINEALLYQLLQTSPQGSAKPAKAASESWFWAALMGLSMFIGALLAMGIAATRVVLPYDEALAGLTRDEMIELNCRLLPFMQHDRVTLAGTMLAIGLLYMAYAWWGVRRGVHWAYMAIVVSAMAGFLSFFSFLGFGYFDPFHAFVTAILFQFLLMAMHAHLPPRQAMEPPGLRNDRRWRLNHWGQLLFVAQGAALILAGSIILKIGMTTVFVEEDLEFMQTTAAELFGAHPRLVPLVAHDRATFGGMLLACGIATILPALWGFGRGQVWLWWSLMVAGTAAYCATLDVHWLVGYHSLEHLLPAIGGLVLLWIAGGLSYGYVAAPDPPLEAEWRRRIAALKRVA